MAVMHKKTFKIYHNDQNIVPEDYAEIDELIAPVIQVLNQKGYTTRFCCSGHIINNRLIRDANEEKGYHKACTSLALDSYITFEEGISLPSLPPEFKAEQNTSRSITRLTIRKTQLITNVFDHQFYEKSRKILATMEQLYHWALDLPNIETK